MAKVTRDLSARSYIATENFAGDFLKYVVSKVDFKTVGSLSPVTTNLADCPAGRVLRENGRKLAPGMNPNVPTYMLGVYDNQSGLSGFIDPNSPVFAVYSDNRPNFLVDNVDPGDGANGGSQNLTDRSAPVLTNGLVSAATTVSAGLTVTAGTNLQAPNGKLVVGSFSGGAAAATYAAGSAAVGIVSMAAGSTADAGFRKVTVNTSACQTTSRIFLTYSGLNSPGVLSVENISNGSFRIVSNNTSDAGSVQFLIIN